MHGIFEEAAMQVIEVRPIGQDIQQPAGGAAPQGNDNARIEDPNMQHARFTFDNMQKFICRGAVSDADASQLFQNVLNDVYCAALLIQAETLKADIERPIDSQHRHSLLHLIVFLKHITRAILAQTSLEEAFGVVSPNLVRTIFLQPDMRLQDVATLYSDHRPGTYSALLKGVITYPQTEAALRTQVGPNYSRAILQLMSQLRTPRVLYTTWAADAASLLSKLNLSVYWPPNIIGYMPISLGRADSALMNALGAENPGHHNHEQNLQQQQQTRPVNRRGRQTQRQFVNRNYRRQDRNVDHVQQGGFRRQDTGRGTRRGRNRRH